MVLTNRINFLTAEITKLRKLATDNLSIGNSLLEKRLVDNIEAYLENNRRIESKIEEYSREVGFIKRAISRIGISG